MKKLLAILCIIAMMFAICACGDSEPAPAPAPDQTPAAEQTPPADTSDNTAQAPATGVKTDLEDGFYMTGLNDSPQSEDDYLNGIYTFAVNENTEYRTGGSDGVRGSMTQAEFQEFMSDLMNSGLGFEIKVENGIAVEVGVYS